MLLVAYKTNKHKLTRGARSKFYMIDSGSNSHLTLGEDYKIIRAKLKQCNVLLSLV